MNQENKDKKDTRIQQIGEGFFNIRGSFRVFLGLVDVGTQMSLARLKNGNFLVLDAIPLSPELKTEIDVLTENGSKLEAFIGCHPFHTLAIRDFHQAYPKIPYYGCPRHLRMFPEISWAGDLQECAVREKWKAELDMRIPAGAEFVDPQPESRNHFSSVVVFHRASKTVHADDTINYLPKTGLIGTIMRIAGFTEGYMSFHPTLKNVGLLPYVDAPYKFRDWVKSLVEDWDFENLCAAHTGNKIGGARDMLRELLESSNKTFDDLREQRIKDNQGESGPAQPDEEGYNVTPGVECG